MIFISSIPSDEYRERFSSLAAVLQMQRSVLEAYDFSRLEHALDTIPSLEWDKVLRSAQVASETLAQMNLPELEAYESALSNAVSRIASLNLDPISSDRLAILISNMRDLTLRQLPGEEAIDAAFRAIQDSREYLTEDQENTLNSISPEILSPAEAPAKPRRLTFSDILALISVILALIQLILQQLPNEQLDKLIEQNETQIEQNEMLIEQNSREIELLLQLVDAQQQLSVYVEENKDSLLELDDPLLEGGDALLKADDLVDLPVEEPEAPADGSDQQKNAQPENE